ELVQALALLGRGLLGRLTPGTTAAPLPISAIVRAAAFRASCGQTLRVSSGRSGPPRRRLATAEARGKSTSVARPTGVVPDRRAGDGADGGGFGAAALDASARQVGGPMARACALHRATDAVVRARRAGRGPRFGGGFRLRAPAADELRVDLSERSGRREHRRAGAHDTSLAARRGATTVRAVLGRAAMQPFRVLEHSWTGQVGPAGEGGAQSALEPARVRCGAPGGAGQRRARRAARLARGAVDAAASPGQACAERRTSGFGRAARLGLAAAREERESRDRREPGARATNGQEYAEGCGKRCRTERPRGEGPRGIHFGGQGRRAPPPRPMLERRA